MKKFAAILLALLLVLSMTTTAFAAEETGTITVNGAVNGETYTLYKIFDVTEVNGSDAYSIPNGKNYSDTADFADLFETNITKISDTESVTYVTRKTGVADADIIAWAQANIDFFDDAVATEVAADRTVEFTGLTSGYYYIDSPVSNDAVAMIAHSSLTAAINEKNSKPGWDKDEETKGGKEADGDTYYAGETIKYTLTYYNALNYDEGEQVTKYIIEDALPAGITYNGNVSATVNGTTVDLTNEGDVDNGFKVSIAWVAKDEEGNITEYKYPTDPSTIVVTYTATMGNTKIAEGITNTAKIYPDTNTNPGDETEKEDTVYTGQIKLTKVDLNDTSKVLSGAKFKVMVNDGETEGYLKETSNGYEVGTAEEAKEFVTDANGLITLMGLKAGTYTFVETEAPAGYNLPDDTQEKPAVTLELTEGENGAVVATSMSQPLSVANSKAAAMPETGGMGTTLFYLTGGLLAVCAMVLLITQKRMKVEQ